MDIVFFYMIITLLYFILFRKEFESIMVCISFRSNTPATHNSCH